MVLKSAEIWTESLQVVKNRKFVREASISEEHTAFYDYPDDGDNICVRNGGKLLYRRRLLKLPKHTASTFIYPEDGYSTSL